MARFVDDVFVQDLQNRLQSHFAGSASVILAGPGLGHTDECTAVVTFTHAGKQHHTNIEFAVADRSAIQVKTELIGQIVRWMEAAQAA